MKRKILILFLAIVSVFSSAQNPKEKMEISMDVKERGVYSVSVCDADIVLPDSVQANAVAQLLLCSEIRGRVESPNYYFDNPTRQKDAELDLLLLTQGWRRYEVENIMNEKYPQIDHSIETSQTISGHVERTLNKTPKNMKLLVLSPMVGGMQEFQLQDSSRFVIGGLDFVDGTPFTLQATTQKGRTNFIQIYVTPDDFPKIKPIRTAHRQSVAEKFVEQSANLHKVDDIRNMQYLDEVVVIGKRILNPLGLQPDRMLGEGDYWLEHSGVTSLIAQRLGLIATGVGDNVHIGRYRKYLPGALDYSFVVATPTIIIDGFVATEEEFLRLPTCNIKQVEFFRDNSEIPAVYGLTGMHDILLVFTKPIARIGNNSLSMKNIRPLGYSQPVEFYSPQYPLEDKDIYTYPDYRTTLYWNPVQETDGNGKMNIGFYNSDTAKRYIVTVEGVSDDGEIVSETKIIDDFASKNTFIR